VLPLQYSQYVSTINSTVVVLCAVAGKSAAVVKRLIASKIAVKEASFKAITAFVLNRHATNVNCNTGKEERLTKKLVKDYTNK
jgi:hypothetical protein